MLDDGDIVEYEVTVHRFLEGARNCCLSEHIAVYAIACTVDSLEVGVVEG